MYDMNKVFLLGYLGQDPELCVSKTGNEYTKLSIATHRSWRDINGGEMKRTDWHDVTVWGRKAQLCRNNLRKGSRVLVEGTISVVEFTDPEGKKTRSPWITAKEVIFLRPQQNNHSELTEGPSQSL